MEKLKALLVNSYSADPDEPIELIRDGIDNDVYTFINKSGKKNIARVSKRQIADSVEFETKLIQALQKGKVKVPEIVLDKDENTYNLLNSKVVICFEYIDGKPVKYEQSYTPDHNKVRQAGLELGKFHNITASLEISDKNRRNIYTELERAVDNQVQIEKNYEGGHLFIESLEKSLDQARQKTFASGIIHNDYNTSNILFNNSGLIAIVDFDWSCYGPLLTDVGHGAMNWSTPQKDTKPNEDAFKEFIRSYNTSSNYKVKMNNDLYFWTAYSCLYLASNLLCDSLAENRYNISDVDQSWMYRRYKYYIDLIE